MHLLNPNLYFFETLLSHNWLLNLLNEYQGKYLLLKSIFQTIIIESTYTF